MGKWDIKKAVDYISKNALEKSIGRCARYVRTAIEAGGLSTEGRPASACQYVNFLPTIGFTQIEKITGKVKQYNWSLKNANPGDIAVMNYGKHGHICMWDGKNWVSDFRQNNMWVYKGDGECVIFRYNA
jgi:hypothetical protein